MAEKHGKPLTMSIPEAGWKYFGLSRMGSYAAAQRGDLVVTDVGGLRKVVTAAMDAKMARAVEKAQEKVTETKHRLSTEK